MLTLQKSWNKTWRTAIGLLVVVACAGAGSCLAQTGSQYESFSWPAEDFPGPGQTVYGGQDGADCYQEGSPAVKMMWGVDQQSARGLGREPRWNDQQMVPWEDQAYGSYLGPIRPPHTPEIRLRINDTLDFVYMITRRADGTPYQFYPGDTISITASGDPSLNQPSLLVLSDGTVSLPLIGTVVVAGKTVQHLTDELNYRFREEGNVRDPRVVVQVIRGDTPQEELRQAIVANFGQNGQSRQVVVSPDGTIQLPLIGPVPALGLTLEEMAREVNARYSMYMRGITVNPILVQRAEHAVYVLGQVNQPGRIVMNGPTSVMQAIAQAGGWQNGSNLRQIIVFRRDANWQLVATKIDLRGALNGRRPYPADEIWLSDSDIVLIPKSPIQRFSEGVDLYLARSLYSIFPAQGVTFNFDGLSTF